MNSPFDEDPPKLARDAAWELQWSLPELSEGKMFGVLVCTDRQERDVVLHAFSGMYQGRWDVEGFVPPIFDRAQREAIEPAFAKELRLRGSEYRAFNRLLKHAETKDQSADEERALREELAANKADRDARRARNELVSAHESQQDSSKLRRAKQRWKETRESLEMRSAQLARMKREHAERSRAMLLAVFDAYTLESFSGRKAKLIELYAPKPPPSGAGDCCAPKLLVAARKRNLLPRAIAEFWWGPPPPGGGRQHGQFYAACHDKCVPLLPFLYEGLEVDAPKRARRRQSAPDLSIIYQDTRLLAINKPAGQPSVSTPDSIEALVKQRFSNASLVHRLDEDTSGVLLVALDPEAHALIQRQFLHRLVRKKYIAWLEGQVAENEGRIDLPLRPDLELRPRQLVDRQHGKRARTRWKVLERISPQTKIAFFPETGRTHQLRVHAAHPDGLNAPIVGDRLYGRPGERLMLHAEALWLVHPDGTELTLTAPAPF